MIAFEIIHNLKIRYRDFQRIWFHKYKVDLGLTTAIPLPQRIKYNRLGFTIEDYYNFNLKSNDYRDYISFRERWRLESINGRFAFILGEKLLFERIWGNYIDVPHINCWVKNKTCIDIESGNEIDILSILEKKKNLIAKPTRSVGGGTGLHRLSFDEQNYSIDGVNYSEQDIKAAVGSWEEDIITDYISQAEYSKTIYPESTNSIRVVTGHHKDGRFEVLLAFHRFGSELSKPVDNISSGGLVALIDIETGELGEAKRKTEPGKVYLAHPETKARIKGIQVLNWERIKDKLLQVHKCFPFYNFLAWDVVVGENGVPYILEINRGTDLGVQMLKPLRKEKIGKYMEEFGLLDNR